MAKFISFSPVNFAEQNLETKAAVRRCFRRGQMTYSLGFICTAQAPRLWSGALLLVAFLVRARKVQSSRQWARRKSPFLSDKEKHTVPFAHGVRKTAARAIKLQSSRANARGKTSAHGRNARKKTPAFMQAVIFFIRRFP